MISSFCAFLDTNSLKISFRSFRKNPGKCAFSSWCLHKTCIAAVLQGIKFSSRFILWPNSYLKIYSKNVLEWLKEVRLCIYLHFLFKILSYHICKWRYLFQCRIGLINVYSINSYIRNFFQIYNHFCFW